MCHVPSVMDYNKIRIKQRQRGCLRARKLTSKHTSQQMVITLTCNNVMIHPAIEQQYTIERIVSKRMHILVEKYESKRML